MKPSFVFTMLLLCSLSCSDETEETTADTLPYFPSENTWQTVSPASLGWNTAALSQLEDFLVTNNTRAFIILKDGRIAFEKYWGKQFDGATDFSASSNWYWASAGKTLTAAAVGIAEAQGKLMLNASTSSYLGSGWSSLDITAENKITVWHQLTMTTGLDDAVVNPDCTEKSCLQFKADPGTRWAYHNAPYTLLDDVIAAATDLSLNAFVTNEIQSRTGMDGMFLKTVDNNVYYSTARSMARFGLLLLNGGQWSGTEVIPADYVSQMTASSQDLNRSYGLLTWLNGKESFMVPVARTVFPGSISPAAPADMFAAMGKNGQLINVVLGERLVVIRMGDVPDDSLVPFRFQNALWEELNKVF